MSDFQIQFKTEETQMFRYRTLLLIVWWLIDITQTHLEQVKSFKYLGSIVNGNNLIEEEIKRIISLRNNAFYANQDPFKSKLLTQNSKLRMYKTLVRQTSGNICLWNVGTEIKHKNHTKGIWEEGTKKNLWTH
jgi:hypothetical protein